MDVNEVLIELFDRVDQHVDEVVEGLAAELVTATPGPGTNSVGWLVWHLTRVQDDHVADLLDEQQVWETGDWARRFGVEPDPHNTGYGHSPEDVAAIRPDGPGVLVDYYDAVAARTHEFLRRTTAADLDTVVDDNWDPPVTLGVRLISIADDDIQHAGQAMYVKGLLSR